MSVLHNLQQNSRNIPMGFFHFIQQNQRIWPAAHLFRERPAFFIAHIPRRRADESGYRLLFHILRHVQPDHGVLAAVKLSGQRPAQFCLANACGSCKQKRRHRSVLIRQTGTPPAHRAGRRRHRLGLSNNLPVQPAFQLQQTPPFFLAQFSHRNPRPGGYRPCNVLGCNCSGLPAGGSTEQPLHFVPQLRRLFKAAFPHSAV